MTAPRTLCLKFSQSIHPTIQARVSYAFRVFAAVYGHKIVDDESEPTDTCCFYGPPLENEPIPRLLSIPALYEPRPFDRPTPPLILHKHADQEFRLFFGVEPETGNADWLGEIFEWLSCSDEKRIAARDSNGRIPYEQTLFARFGITPATPHASLIMAWLESFIEGDCASMPRSLPRAASPFTDCDHAVVCSHDIDYYFTNRGNALLRLLKNHLIAILSRDRSFFESSVSELWRFLRGSRFGDFLPQFLAVTEEYQLRATLFLIARMQHRRDGNSRLDEIMPRMREASRKGFSLGLHGSYQSIVEKSDLAPEAGLLENSTGAKPAGGRQHWLRFDRYEKLFQNITDAGLLYDSTLGFVETVGFRNGAAFPFPPYNFEKEQPYAFLEIPLAVMDTGLWHATRSSGAGASSLAGKVLDQSRRWGWGGIAVLWHNPLEAVGVSKEINRVFWEQLRQSPRYRERWTSAEDVLACVIRRYHQAGLLVGEKVNVASAAA